MNLYEYRAQCVRVVDGDTLDLFVDLGFHAYRLERFRLFGVNTAELNTADPIERARAKQAQEQMLQWLTPSAVYPGPDSKWPIRVKTYKSDSFGRFLCDLWIKDSNGEELFINEELVRLGLAVPFMKK